MVFSFDHLFFGLFFLYCSTFIFLFYTANNPFIVLILLEMQLIFLSLFFVYFSHLNHSVMGYIFAIFIIAFAGAEASVGISLLIVFYSLRGLFSLEYPSVLSRV